MLSFHRWRVLQWRCTLLSQGQYMQCWAMCQRKQSCRYICEETGCTTDKQSVSRWKVRMSGQFHVLSTTIWGLGMLFLTIGIPEKRTMGQMTTILYKIEKISSYTAEFNVWLLLFRDHFWSFSIKYILCPIVRMASIVRGHVFLLRSKKNCSEIVSLSIRPYPIPYAFYLAPVANKYQRLDV